MPAKLRIGIDIDDTLLNSVDVITGLNNELYGTKLVRDDWFNVSPGAFLNWQLAGGPEISDRVHELMVHEKYMESVVAIEGAKAVLDRIALEGHQLFAVTSRPNYVREQTVRELEQCFPGLFSDETLYMINAFSADPTVAAITKRGVAQELALTHFIDDLPVHANAVAESGIHVVLFSDNYLWNQTGIRDDVTRLTSWKAIGDYLDAAASSEYERF